MKRLAAIIESEMKATKAGLTKLPRPGVVLARRKDKVLGPAGKWLAERLLAAEAAGRAGSGPPIRGVQP